MSLKCAHQREFGAISLKQTEMELVIEAKDKEHAMRLVCELESAGFKVDYAKNCLTAPSTEKKLFKALLYLVFEPLPLRYILKRLRGVRSTGLCSVLSGGSHRMCHLRCIPWAAWKIVWDPID